MGERADIDAIFAEIDRKDEEWRKRSSVGRAYDAGLALSRSLKGEG